MGQERVWECGRPWWVYQYLVSPVLSLPGLGSPRIVPARPVELSKVGLGEAEIGRQAPSRSQPPALCRSLPAPQLLEVEAGASCLAAPCPHLQLSPQ